MGEDLYSYLCCSDVHTCKEASMAVIQISMLYQYVEAKQYVEVWHLVSAKGRALPPYSYY